MQDLRTAAPALTTLSEEENMFRDAVREFAETEVRPHVQAMDEAAQFRADLIPKFFELGLMGIEVPEQYGGAGGSIFMAVLAIEELARVDASAAIYVDVHNTLVNNGFLRWGSDEQQRRYFPRLTTDLLGAFALSEPGSGSDAFALETRAERTVDGWELTGRKFWITNGAEAGVFIVFANADPSKGYKGITGFIVEREFSGLLGRQEGEQARHPRLEHDRAHPGAVPGARGQRARPRGPGIQDRDRDPERGADRHRRADDRRGARARSRRRPTYVKERRQFGKAIAEFQGVQFQLAQMATDLEAARLMVYNAARLKDAGQPFAQQAAMAKLFSSQVADRTTSNCLELFGGYGYSKEYPAEKYYRDAKIGTIYEGTSNMQLQTIAKTLLK